MFTAFIKILPVGEIPSHNHTGSINTAGEHTHLYGGHILVQMPTIDVMRTALLIVNHGGHHLQETIVILLQ